MQKFEVNVQTSRGKVIAEVTIDTGSRVHYFGDQCNPSGDGRVSAIIKSRWGTDILIQMDSGERRSLTPSAFVGTHSRAAVL